MVVIVRKDLKMRIGKIAAQVGHAAISLYRKLVDSHPEVAQAWAGTDFPKRIFYCPNEQRMDAVREQAKQLGYKTAVIHDAGRTQIASGSATCLSIGPVPLGLVGEVVPGDLRPMP
jgi:PTH2 family peptidyl-tRNA hydrolase